MSNDVLTVTTQDVRGTDSNSLLRIRDCAHEVLMNSHLQTERKRAESAIQRITKEMQRRNVLG